MFGYHGCYLRIDVTRGRVERVPIAEAVLRQFIGGSGLGAWLLLHEGQAAGDPFDPAAPLIFAFSPLVGSPLTTSAKFAVVSKSPLTERINDSLAGSGFALFVQVTVGQQNNFIRRYQGWSGKGHAAGRG